MWDFCKNYTLKENTKIKIFFTNKERKKKRNKPLWKFQKLYKVFFMTNIKFHVLII